MTTLELLGDGVLTHCRDPLRDATVEEMPATQFRQLLERANVHFNDPSTSNRFMNPSRVATCAFRTTLEQHCRAGNALMLAIDQADMLGVTVICESGESTLCVRHIKLHMLAELLYAWSSTHQH
jgi:hypothetical protein